MSHEQKTAKQKSVFIFVASQYADEYQSVMFYYR